MMILHFQWLIQSLALMYHTWLKGLTMMVSLKVFDDTMISLISGKLCFKDGQEFLFHRFLQRNCRTRTIGFSKNECCSFQDSYEQSQRTIIFLIQKSLRFFHDVLKMRLKTDLKIFQDHPLIPFSND